jgi:hypothetical protein
MEIFISDTRRNRGYYGKPWTGDQRCDLFALMQAQGMNSYFYAAIYDAYHRERWRELYRPDVLAGASPRGGTRGGVRRGFRVLHRAGLDLLL